MPRVAFVMPVLNEQERIGPLLSALRSHFPDSDLIVVDGGSSDATVERAMPLADQLLVGPAGRASQMNLGGRASAAQYLFFLHADSQPEFDACVLNAHLDLGPQWGFCHARLDGAATIYRVIAWFMNQRSRLTSVATGDQMLFVHRDVFASTGGFDAIPLMEDVAYCKRLRAQSKPLVLPETVLSSSRRWQQNGVVRTIVTMWWLRLAYVLGVSPQRLWQTYYGRNP
ncbi:MAG: TIGR04283 family arsenosugar biosynthesis glycosyltransferase [Pseudomonadota bacterium]